MGNTSVFRCKVSRRPLRFLTFQCVFFKFPRSAVQFLCMCILTPFILPLNHLTLDGRSLNFYTSHGTGVSSFHPPCVSPLVCNSRCHAFNSPLSLNPYSLPLPFVFIPNDKTAQPTTPHTHGFSRTSVPRISLLYAFVSV